MKGALYVVCCGWWGWGRGWGEARASVWVVWYEQWAAAAQRRWCRMQDACGGSRRAQYSDVAWLRSAGCEPLAQEVSECSAVSSSRPAAAGGQACGCRRGWHSHSSGSRQRRAQQSGCTHRSTGQSQRGGGGSLTDSRHSRGNRRWSPLDAAPESSRMGRDTAGFSNHSRCRVLLHVWGAGRGAGRRGRELAAAAAAAA